MTYLEISFKIFKNVITQTVEAEIKAVVRAQRVRGAESRVVKQAAKWTAEGAWNG
mgnify:CR=1 FL=1